MSELIITHVADGVASLTLNRPRAINALNADMLTATREIIARWSADDDVHRIELFGCERGFCSGADIRELAGLVTANGEWLEWLRNEYGLHRDVMESPKRITAHLSGITMGGGLGLGSSADRRIVDPTTVMAMPETKIGWFPDAGMMYFLARGGAVGVHCALTSATFGGGDALKMGIADESADGTLPAPLHDAPWIEDCYASEDPVQIIQALENHPHPEAQATAGELRARSPLAVHVAMRALQRARELDRTQVFEQDLALSSKLLPIDFPEGVRALLIDKDNAPAWRHSSIETVSSEEVEEIFSALGGVA